MRVYGIKLLAFTALMMAQIGDLKTEEGASINIHQFF